MSDCNACFYAGDYDGPDLYYKQVRKARKVHKCCECSEEIKPGSEYEHVSGKWDGRMDEFKTCLVCAEIRDTFGCEGYVHAQLWENIMESMFEEMSIGCLDKLASAAAKQKLLDEWNAWKFD